MDDGRTQRDEGADDPGRSREAVPDDAEEVDERAEDVERLERHSQRTDDPAGINPERRQGTGTPEPD